MAEKKLIIPGEPQRPDKVLKFDSAGNLAVDEEATRLLKLEQEGGADKSSEIIKNVEDTQLSEPELVNNLSPAEKKEAEPIIQEAEEKLEEAKTEAINEIKKINIAIVDVEAKAKSMATLRARKEMTEEIRTLKSFGGFFKEIWKHNIMSEAYHEKKTRENLRKIAEQKNVFASEDQMLADEKIKNQEEFSKNITERFATENDDLIEKSIGEVKSKVDREDVKNSIKSLIISYANDEISKEDFIASKDRIIGNVRNNNKEILKSNLRVDNILASAEEIKKIAGHQSGLANLQFDIDLNIGRAMGGIKTETSYSDTERIIAKMGKTKLGALLMNETTLAGSVIAGHLVGSAVFAKMGSSMLAKGVTFFAGMGLASAYSYKRESYRTRRDRETHSQELAEKGGKMEIESQPKEPVKPDRNASPAEKEKYNQDRKQYRKDSRKWEKEYRRRLEIEPSRHETILASALVGELKKAYDDQGNFRKDLSDNEKTAILQALSEAIARTNISNEKRIDLIAFSDIAKVEAERTELLKLISGIKSNLNNLKITLVPKPKAEVPEVPATPEVPEAQTPEQSTAKPEALSPELIAEAQGKSLEEVDAEIAEMRANIKKGETKNSFTNRYDEPMVLSSEDRLRDLEKIRNLVVARQEKEAAHKKIALEIRRLNRLIVICRNNIKVGETKNAFTGRYDEQLVLENEAKLRELENQKRDLQKSLEDDVPGEPVVEAALPEEPVSEPVSEPVAEPSPEFEEQMSNVDYEQILNNLIATKTRELLGNMEKRDEIFEKLRKKRSWKSAKMTMLVGTTIGIVAQEIGAFFQDRVSGFAEELFKHQMHTLGVHHHTMLAGLANFLDGKFGTGALTHVFEVGHGAVTLPKGAELVLQGDGSYNLMDNGHLVVDKLHIDPETGAFSDASRDILEKAGLSLGEKSAPVEHLVTTHVTDHDMIDHSQEIFGQDPDQVARVLWLDENTPAPKFDLNELREDLSMNENGDYVISMKRMLENWSFHDTTHVNPWQALADGQLKIEMSISEGTQGHPFGFVLDASGNATIPHDSEFGQIMFTHEGNVPHCEARFVEVVKVVGETPSGNDALQILATFEGDGVDSTDITIKGVVDAVKSNITGSNNTELPYFAPIRKRRPLERITNLFRRNKKDESKPAGTPEPRS